MERSSGSGSSMEEVGWIWPWSGGRLSDYFSDNLFNEFLS